MNDMFKAQQYFDQAVITIIDQWYSGTLPGGTSLTPGVDSNSVGLAMDTSLFEVFTQAQYDQIYEDILDGTVVPRNDWEVSIEEMQIIYEDIELIFYGESNID